MLEVIAEASSNHNGNLQDAIELINIAARAKASSVKFQFIFPDGLYVPKYISGGQVLENDVYRQREQEMLTDDEWSQVWIHATKMGLEVFASVFCVKGVRLLKELGSRTVKIASTDLNNTELIKMCLEEFDRCILSTGMASFSDIENTLLEINYTDFKSKIELMHCVSSYPCALEKCNLKRIKALEATFGIKVGYSDHTLGVASACAAMALGCTTFEKHFTFDQNLSGFDHAHAEDALGLSRYTKQLSQLSAGLDYQVKIQQS